MGPLAGEVAGAVEAVVAAKAMGLAPTARDAAAESFRKSRRFANFVFIFDIFHTPDWRYDYRMKARAFLLKAPYFSPVF
jgi:hypothetical protein